MLPAMLNRATMRVADTTEVSGRVTADSIEHGLYAKKQGGEVPMKFAQVLLCVAAVGFLSSCASSTNSPQSSSPPKSNSDVFAQRFGSWMKNSGSGRTLDASSYDSGH